MKKKILVMLILCSTVSVFSACGPVDKIEKDKDKEIVLDEEVTKDKEDKDTEKEENTEKEEDTEKEEKEDTEKESSNLKGNDSSIEKPLGLDEKGKIEIKVFGGSDKEKNVFVTMAIEDIYRGKDAEKYVEQFNEQSLSVKIGELEKGCEYFVVEYSVEAPKLEEKEVLYADLGLKIKGVDGETLKIDDTRYYVSSVGMEEEDTLKSEQKLDKMYLISQIPKKADEFLMYFDKNGKEGSYYLYKK